MNVARVTVGVALAVLTTSANAAEIVVFAAGSLRAPLTDVAREFERASGHKVVLTFGASGLLRDRINSGERADVFASANLGPRIKAFHALYYHREPTDAQVRALLETAGVSK